MNREKKITVFGDSIGKGVFTDGGKIEVIKDNAVRLFEEWKGIEIDNRSGYGQSLKRLLDKGVIEKYIAGLDKSKRNIAVIELGGNDADFDWKAVADAPIERFKERGRRNGRVYDSSDKQREVFRQRYM